MERETRKVTIPNTQIEVELCSYITAREVFGIQKAPDATEYLIGQLVKSFDGSTENIVDRVLSLPIESYKFIDEELVKLLPANEKKT